MEKIYICGSLPFTANEVHPTMTTPSAEKPRHVKRVHSSQKSGCAILRDG